LSASQVTPTEERQIDASEMSAIHRPTISKVMIVVTTAALSMRGTTSP